MEFLDKLTKKASQTYKGATEKTGKIAKEAKLKMKISDNKCKIEDLYQEIGQKVYQKHTANEDLCIKKDLEEECAKIDILSSEIETYHREILSLSDIKVCEKCKETMKKEANYCPNCGEKQPVEEKNEDRAMEVEIIDNYESEVQNEEEKSVEEEQEFSNSTQEEANKNSEDNSTDEQS